MITIVVAAAVIEQDHRFLVTKRQAGVHLEGYWEFPGGKCESGEAHGPCLQREILEELGVETLVGDEVLATTHTYPDRHVELHFLRCRLIGEPRPQLGQQMRWVSRDELTTLAFPPGDAALIRMLIDGTAKRGGRAPESGNRL
jgi:8-oxo-dGTP diphosphatase